MVLIFHNDHRLNIDNSLRAIYNTLMNNEEFKNFGETKVIIVSALINDSEFNFHHIVIIKNDSIFEDYYNAVKDIVNTHYEEGYPVDIIQSFKVRVWNVDMLENKDIKLTSSAIKINRN